MISIKDTALLPDSTSLKKACKAMAVLDAILCQDWVYRYHSYNCDWADGEEFFEMRNGEGDQLLILFQEGGTVINGFSSEAEEQADKEQLAKELPQQFHEFIFGEPVHSIGTSFCLWKTAGEAWRSVSSTGEDISEELLSPLDGVPATYVRWATEYFKGAYLDTGLPIPTVTKIFDQEPLTKEMLDALITKLEDREQLQADLEEISYPHHISY